MRPWPIWAIMLGLVWLTVLAVVPYVLLSSRVDLGTGGHILYGVVIFCYIGWGTVVAGDIRDDHVEWARALPVLRADLYIRHSIWLTYPGGLAGRAIWQLVRRMR